MAFDPKQHIIKLKGKDYLEVKWRLVWFRDKYPQGVIKSEVKMLSELVAIVTTDVCEDDGQLLATGMATVRSPQNAVWSGRDFEKAETAAIGRALAHAGFGTQFDGDDEGDYLADNPIEPSGYSKKPPPKMSKTMPDSSAGNAPIEQLATDETVVVVTKKKGKETFMTVEGCTLWSRESFLDLNYDKSVYDGLAETGVTTLPDPIQIVFYVNEKGYKEVLRIQRVSTKKVFTVKELI